MELRDNRHTQRGLCPRCAMAVIRTLATVVGMFAFLFIVNTAHAQVPASVVSITDMGTYAAVVLENPMAAPSGSYPTNVGVLPMRGLYTGTDMFDLMPNDTSSDLKCDGSLQDAPSFASATSTATINISYSFHGGYSGPWASNTGVLPCTGAGVYYVQWSNAGQTYYFQYYWNGTTVEEISPDFWINQNAVSDTYETRFLNATAVASTTLSLTVGYYIDTDDFAGPFDRPDVILVNVSSLDTTQFESIQKLILPLSTGYATITLTGVNAIPDGNYSAMINFWNFSTQKFALNRSAFTVNFTVSAGVVTTQTQVANTNALFPESSTVYEDCGITAISGCISNSFRFLFYPSIEAVSQVTALQGQLQTKAPFVYAYQLSDVFETLYNSPSLASSSITVSILGGNLTLLSVAQLQAVPYTAWLRSILGYIMWVLFAFLVYRKALRVFNTNPQ